jgi:hypothetical protein
MAKRITTTEKQIREAIKKNLNEIGRKTSAQSKRTSKIAKSTDRFTGGSLRDSGNYRVKPYNVLTLSENFYGKYNTPKGKATPADRDNIKDTALQLAIDDNVPDGTNLMINDIMNLLTAPIL